MFLVDIVKACVSLVMFLLGILVVGILVGFAVSVFVIGWTIGHF